MKKNHILVILQALLLLMSIKSLWAQDDDLYSFDVDEFTKKTFEWKGEIELSGGRKFYNKDSVLYAFKVPEGDSHLDEGEFRVSLEGRWDWEWSRLFLVGEGAMQRSSQSENDEDETYWREAYWQLAAVDPHSVEIGKRLLRWGKGYAFNPVALMERSKNPNDPEADRQGLWLGTINWITGEIGFLENSSVTLVYLPLANSINDDYLPEEYEDPIWGIKIYGLIGTTDIDLYYVKKEELEETDIGLDFSSNLSTNFEIHGEYASYRTSNSDSHSSLIGLRYLTESDITWIVEHYYDSEGLTATELESIYKGIENAKGSQVSSYMAQIQDQKTLTRNYGYLKVSVKEPFDWLYFTPSLAVLSNLDDGSHSTIATFGYDPSDGLKYLLTLQQQMGQQYTQYGENLTQNRASLEIKHAF